MTLVIRDKHDNIHKEFKNVIAINQAGDYLHIIPYNGIDFSTYSIQGYLEPLNLRLEIKL